VWFPIVERAHTRATDDDFDDDDDERHRDATSNHASVDKRVLCTAPASMWTRVR
jgi:hypothetical protein